MMYTAVLGDERLQTEASGSQASWNQLKGFQDGPQKSILQAPHFWEPSTIPHYLLMTRLDLRVNSQVTSFGILQAQIC